MIVYRSRVTCESPEPDLTVIHSPVVPYYSAGKEYYKYMCIIVYIINLFCLYCGPISAYTGVLTCSCPKWHLRVVKHNGRAAGGHTRSPWTVTVGSDLEHTRVWSGNREDSRLCWAKVHMHSRLVNSKLALTMDV